MENQKVIDELQRYEKELEAILGRFSRDYHIARDDDSKFRQYVRELLDLFNDALGRNAYSSQIAEEANQGVNNYMNSPSYKSVENILAVVRASLTRLKRNPDLLIRKEAAQHLQHRENVFIIHGRNEAKWRELKDIVKSQFRLNPIVLMEEPEIGSETVIEKFERYAETCSYAIALFTPDDEVISGGEKYLQARPNVIYELGWFCGRLGRSSILLLLQTGTSLFSDFGGIIRKEFGKNISEKTGEIRASLIAAGIIDVS
ncbi:MAG: nucleotide-binding protein [Xanthobacteraceae bacterium]